MIFNLLINNYCTYSALEQFEVIPYTNFRIFGMLPKLEYFLFSVPVSLINNITLLFLMFAYTLRLTLRGLFSSIQYRANLDLLAFVVRGMSLFVYHQILGNLSYGKNQFFNYYFTLFIFLLAANLLGMVPYSLTVTSYIILTLTLSGMSFFGNLYLAIKVNKVRFFLFFCPTGISEILVPFMVVIETISYITRLFSMAIRLFANMLSGHALVKILSGLVFSSFDHIVCYGIISIIFNIVVIAVTALEVIVASLQAYVFVVLSVIYTNEAILLH